MSALPHAQPSASRANRNPDFVALLDHLGVLQVSGEDAASFLQGQLSVDVQGLKPRESTFGAYCSPKGRMLASFLLWRDETGFLAALSRDLAAATQKQLSKFVRRSKVKVLEASGAMVVGGPAGPNAERALSAFPGTPLKLSDGRLLHALSAAGAPGILRG